jgi:3-phosphoshikimate 1-carboxyvinyltransferase
VVGGLRPPGSKSLTQRWLLLAALAEGTSTIWNALRSDDVEALAGGLRALGATIRWTGIDSIEVQGVAGRFPRGGTLDAREGGTPARFLMAAAARASKPCTVDGSARLRKRPMEDGVHLLRALGANARRVEASQLPIEVRPGEVECLEEIEIERPASSQFLSAVALVAPWIPGGLCVRVRGGLPSASYLAMTVSCLRHLGVQASWNEQTGELLVQPGPLRGFEVHVEPDASSAAYGWALAAVCPGSEIWIPGLHADSAQPDMAVRAALVALGAEAVERSDGCGVRHAGRLHGGEFDASLWPDGSLAVMAAASTVLGQVRIGGLETLAGKESDRIEAMRAWLESVGAKVERGTDWIRIEGCEPRSPADLVETHRDHRIAMSAAVVGALTGGMRIADPACVEKSWPDFCAVWGGLIASA